MKRIYVYTTFQRFWHWSQAVLILTLAATGFEIHGTYTLFGFEQAVTIHETAAILLLVLVAFAIFWHFVTGGWKEYLPTREGIGAQLRYYTYGMFRNEPHPFTKSEISHLNPLQRIIYLGFKLLIFPVLGTTGLLYLNYNHWPISQDIGLPVIAVIHVGAAIVLLGFIIGHVYMTTTGRTVFSSIKAMITGWEEIDEEEESATPAGTKPAAGD